MNGSSPLQGRRFLITRAADQARPFAERLEALGAQALCVPTIEIVAPESWQPLDQALYDLEDYQVLILTSVNGVRAFFERLQVTNQYYGLLNRILVVAVGPKTAEAIAGHGIRVDLIPRDHRAEGVVAELLERGVAGKSILYPRAEIARPLLVESLRAAGARVRDPVAYRTVVPPGQAARVRELLQEGRLDAICFTSSSTFENLLSMLGDDLHSLLDMTRLFSIGPQTSETIRRHGFEVALQPEQWTLDALAAAMVDYYAQSEAGSPRSPIH